MAWYDYRLSMFGFRANVLVLGDKLREEMTPGAGETEIPATQPDTASS